MFTNLKHLHFLGICGTAMGAVAAALRDQGYQITGSDEDVYPPMSTFLEEKGIVLCKGYRPENLPDARGADRRSATPSGAAIPKVEEVLNRKLPYCSLPEVLKFFFLRGRHNLVVTGTHGKTTTTSLLAWILQSAGLAPGYMIGGLPNNLGQGAQFNASPYYVIEGDEYDTAFFDKRSKFVHYLPELLVINNIEFDHADIYKNVDEIKLSFRRLVNIVPGNGLILYNADDANCVDVVSNAFANRMPVGLNAPANEGRIENIRFEAGQTRFELFGEEFCHADDGRVQRAQLRDGHCRRAFLPAFLRNDPQGFVELHGRAPAAGTARGGQRREGDRRFRASPDGDSRRRCAGCASSTGTVGKLWALFEPRSNSTRRAVFQDQLARAFNDADGVVMARVAKLEQIPEAERLDPERVVEGIRGQGREAFYEDGTEAIIERVKTLAKPGDTIVVFSNGGFDGIHTKLLAALG